MQKVDQPFEQKGPPVVFYLDEIAALRNRLSQYYAIDKILAGDHLLTFDEFPELRMKLEKDRVEYLSFILLDDKLEKVGTLTILPNSTRFEVNRSTPFEIGVWSELRSFLFKHRAGRRFDGFGSFLMLISIMCVAFGTLYLIKDGTEVWYYVIALGAFTIGWLWVISKLINKTRIILWTREERPRKITTQMWITILTSSFTTVLGAVLGAVGKTLADRWLSGAP